ncbi:MAG: DNA primase [Pseudomonadota bacterium]
MSLPPGFLDELRSRLSIGQVVGRKVSWDARKSNQAKGDLWAPCPFHQEKTASFHVDDRKGYYYCFGCQAKGDAIGFVKETENVSFMEAVEILATEAGMQMPARDPKAAEKADRRSQLHEVMEQAVQFFRLQLKAGVGQGARSYLAGRGLNGEAWDRWELGFAPDGWQGLYDHLTQKGVSEDMLLACGLIKRSDKGRKPYDVFRNRIMFPIRDARKRAIAFGGRAMAADDPAKYLNSPETELFDKGRNLYNHAPAREAAGKGERLVVAEGYMDVIALAEAGFRSAVAPLGTAVTEDQLQLLWRISPEPLMALDGDTAGLRAAYRVMDLALPMISPSQSLRFAMMPGGKDPDDLIQEGGSDAVARVLDDALPMVKLMWQRETEDKVFDSPERKAALDTALRALIGKIQDPGLRQHYGSDIKNLRWELFAPKRSAPRGKGPKPAWASQDAPRTSTKGSALAQQGGNDALAVLARIILGVLVKTPEVLPEYEDALERLGGLSADLAEVRSGLLRVARDWPPDLEDALAQSIPQSALDATLLHPHVRVNPAVRRAGDAEIARLCLDETLTSYFAREGHSREIQEIVQDFETLEHESLTWRLKDASQALNGPGETEDDDVAEFETGPNGAKLKKDERRAFDALLENLGLSKDAAEDLPNKDLPKE